MCFVVSSHLVQRQIGTCTQTPTFRKLFIAPLIFIFFSVPGQSEMPHTNVLQTAMTAFSVTKYLRHSEQKRTSEQCHVTNNVIALRLIQEVAIIKSYFYTTLYSCWLQTNQVIWHLRFFSCKGFWEGFYYNYILFL